jgi:hypothetical protein
MSRRDSCEKNGGVRLRCDVRNTSKDEGKTWESLSCESVQERSAT